MTRIRMVILSVLAVFALSAVASAAASAFNLQWEVCKNVGAKKGSFDTNSCKAAGGENEFEWKKLEAGESLNIVSWIVPGTSFALTVGTKVITCTGAADAGTITGGKPGTGNISVLFYGCTTSQAGCLVKTAHQANGVILVPNIATVLVEREPGGGGAKKLADEFKAKPAPLNEFVTLKFEPEAGKSCSEFPETKVKGQVAGEVINLANGNGEIKFPSPELKGNTLESFGAAAKLTGRSEVELENGGAFRGGVEPLPNETTITGFGKTIVNGKEVPVINWGKESPITTKGCKGGKVTVSVEAENTETHKFEHREVTLTESPTGSGKFSGNIPIMKPLHGKGTVKITVSGCEHSGEDIVVEFECYIDPSGTVVDGNHEEAPVWEATVTLLASEKESGPFTAVENGSEVMSPSNRVNPDKTREDGSFGWETKEGFYEVEATKTGCGTATTPAFKVPPPQEKLKIVLHCEGEQWKLGEEGGEKAQLAVTAPARKCEGKVRVENVSFGAAVIKILKETGIECTIAKKACEAKSLSTGEKCESELEKPGTKPEYELEVEWKGKKFTKKFPV